MMEGGLQLDPKLQRAWLLRWNQKIEESARSLAEIQVERNWERLEPDLLNRLRSPVDKENFVEALLLRASLMRAQGHLQKSSSSLRRIAQASDHVLGKRGFRLQFEIGLDYWMQEDAAQAMEAFYLAERQARDNVEKHFALFNLLLCLEAADLPRESVESRIESFLGADDPGFTIENINEQWRAYQMRKAFYSRLRLLDFPKLSGQGAFFRSWVLALPYFSPDWKDRLNLDLESKYVWQGAYRARTLTGIWLPADLESVRITDAIDRLYLWTWWWMAEHPQMSTDKIVWTLESIVRSVEMDGECKDTLFLLRNSLSWLVLIEPRLEPRVSRLLKCLRQLHSPRYQVLEVEYALIQHLVHGGQGGIDEYLREFPCFTDLLRELDGELRDARLPRLARRFKSIHSTKGQGYQLLVDLASSEIKVFDSYRVLRSPGLARMLTLLHEEGRAKFADIAGGEGEVDSQQIYNLVSRARHLVPRSSIYIRGSEVRRGPGWPAMMIVRSSVEEAPSLPTPAQRPASLVDSSSHLHAARALLQEGFVRRDLEKTLRVSKATACRMIEGWLSENLILASGRARTRRYTWSS